MNKLNGTITLIGSGEFGEAMGKVYRALLSRLPNPPNAAFLDTPAGFELNADAIYDKAAEYFSKRLELNLQRASFKNKTRASAIDTAAALNVLRRADFIFAGPGSPSYAIHQWKQTPVWETVRDRMAHDAHLVFASAAAIAVSTFALPVYEIYKAGHDPYWLDGMNLFAALGMNLVIVPHWNNTEGGTYDTRYCYMGEPRFREMERQLPGDAVVLGIDEYTACVFDLSAQTCRVMGTGNVTLRCDGQEWVFAPGETFAFETLRASGLMREPILASVNTAAITKQTDETTRYLIQLARALDETTAPDQKRDLIDRAHDTMHELAADWIDNAHTATQADIAPFVEILIQIRQQLRAAKQFALADEIRARLAALDIVLEDSSAGTTWRKN
jgi:hypothetical protein